MCSAPLSLTTARLNPSRASLIALAQSGARKQIDSERQGGSFMDEKTYEKARSFIRKDSTYYVGYLLEGAYLFFRANDELGFNKASIPLQKALDKIEHDFDPFLRMRTNNFEDYNANYRYHFDYGLITYYLSRCYQNVENEEKAMEVLRHIRDRNFQVEINSDSYNTMAWLYHRNRVFTSSRFPFLKNSVKENVEAANRCLDSAIQKIKNDFPLNNGLYDPNFLNPLQGGTFAPALNIKSVTINNKLKEGPAINNSLIAATRIGTVTLQSLDDSAVGIQYGVLADTSIAKVTVKEPRVRGKPFVERKLLSTEVDDVFARFHIKVD